MDAVFSCRNCVHNCGQTLNLGVGPGFCLKHNSVLTDPDDTTCKYLHRKDLPSFVVDEGVGEHAKEFAFFPTLVTLSTKKPRPIVRYSEKHDWEKRRFAPVHHALAQYHKMKPHWIMVQTFTGGVDGLRAVAHASLVRHYLATCDTWRSSYRLVLGLMQEVDIEPHFNSADLVLRKSSVSEVEKDAVWDVVFARISGIQEYGWHAGIEDITWLTDHLNGGLGDLDWTKLQTELTAAKAKWTDRVIAHAKSEKGYFELAKDEADLDLDVEEP